jgi:hypothetical protein
VQALFAKLVQKNVATAKKAPPEAGDVWTWTAIDADTKLIPSWFGGSRDSDKAIIFMDDQSIQQEDREPRSFSRAVRHILQFRSHP